MITTATAASCTASRLPATGLAKEGTMQDQALELAMAYGPRAFVAAVMLLGGYVAARWAGGVAAKALGRYEIEPPVRALLQNTTRILVFSLFVIMALQNIGVELLPL